METKHIYKDPLNLSDLTVVRYLNNMDIDDL